MGGAASGAPMRREKPLPKEVGAEGLSFAQPAQAKARAASSGVSRWAMGSLREEGPERIVREGSPCGKPPTSAPHKIRLQVAADLAAALAPFGSRQPAGGAHHQRDRQLV